MYIPRLFELKERSEILDVLRQSSFGHLITGGSEAGSQQLASTALPFVVDDDLTRLDAHFAHANEHWKLVDSSEALMIVSSVDTYVSPRWYPSKIEHEKVVPTWNYEVIHVRGTIEIHEEPSWILGHLNELTDHNELSVSELDPAPAWKVSDAPADFVAKLMTAIVGVRLNVTKIEAQRKLSQNKSPADLEGVMQGLQRSEKLRDIATASKMRNVNST